MRNRYARERVRRIAVCLLIGTLAIPAQSLGQATPVADDESRARALALGKQGLEAYRAERYAEAATLFEEAYRIAAVPVFLFNIGKVYEAGGEPLEALEAYERYVAFDTEPESKIQAAREKLVALRDRFPLIQITTDPPGAHIRIDADAGGPAGTSPWEGRLVGRYHTLHIALDEYVPIEQEIWVERGQRQDFAYQLTRESELGAVNFMISEPNVYVRVGEAQLGPSPLNATISLPPGQHPVAFYGPAGFRATTLTVRPGETSSPAVPAGIAGDAPMVAAPLSSARTTWGLVAVGGSVALLATAAVLFDRGEDDYRQADILATRVQFGGAGEADLTDEDVANLDALANDARDREADGDTKQTAALVTSAVALAALGFGVYLLATSDAGAVAPSLRVAPTEGGAVLGFTF